MSYGTIDPPTAPGHSDVDFVQHLQPAASDTARDAEEAHQPALWRRVTASLRVFYDRNFGLFLVFLAQTCGSIVRLASFSVQWLHFIRTWY